MGGVNCREPGANESETNPGPELVRGPGSVGVLSGKTKNIREEDHHHHRTVSGDGSDSDDDSYDSDDPDVARSKTEIQRCIQRANLDIEEQLKLHSATGTAGASVRPLPTYSGTMTKAGASNFWKPQNWRHRVIHLEAGYMTWSAGEDEKGTMDLTPSTDHRALHVCTMPTEGEKEGIILLRPHGTERIYEFQCETKAETLVWYPNDPDPHQ